MMLFFRGCCHKSSAYVSLASKNLPYMVSKYNSGRFFFHTLCSSCSYFPITCNFLGVSLFYIFNCLYCISFMFSRILIIQRVTKSQIFALNSLLYIYSYLPSASYYFLCLHIGWPAFIYIPFYKRKKPYLLNQPNKDFSWVGKRLM